MAIIEITIIDEPLTIGVVNGEIVLHGAGVACSMILDAAERSGYLILATMRHLQRKPVPALPMTASRADE